MSETIAFPPPVDLRKPGHSGPEPAPKTPTAQSIEEIAPDQPRTLRCRWLLTDDSFGQPRIAAQWAAFDD